MSSSSRSRRGSEFTKKSHAKEKCLGKMVESILNDRLSAATHIIREKKDAPEKRKKGDAKRNIVEKPLGWGIYAAHEAVEGKGFWLWAKRDIGGRRAEAQVIINVPGL